MISRRRVEAAVATLEPEVVPQGLNRPARIKVTLTKNRSNQYNVKASHTLPNSELVKSNLSAKYTGAANQFWYRGVNLEYMINCTIGSIKPKVWAQAIAKSIAQMLETEHSVETELLAVEGGGYLSLGNALFKVSAVDYIETGSKALPALRRTVIDDAKQQATSLIIAANKRIEKLHADGETDLLKIQGNIQRERQVLAKIKAEQQLIIPEWMKRGSNMLRVIGQAWGESFLEFGFWCHIQLKTCAWGPNENRKVITCLPKPAVPILMWAKLFPYDGERFSHRSIHIDAGCGGHLPHMSDSSCMNIGDCPAQIASLADINVLRQGVERAMSEFNMDSPLVVYCNWHPQIKAMVPAQLIPYFERWGNREDLHSMIHKPHTYGLTTLSPDGHLDHAITFTVSEKKLNATQPATPNEGDTNAIDTIEPPTINDDLVARLIEDDEREDERGEDESDFASDPSSGGEAATPSPTPAEPTT